MFAGSGPGPILLTAGNTTGAPLRVARRIHAIHPRRAGMMIAGRETRNKVVGDFGPPAAWGKSGAD